jgi:hypothetical protein
LREKKQMIFGTALKRRLCVVEKLRKGRENPVPATPDGCLARVAVGFFLICDSKAALTSSNRLLSVMFVCRAAKVIY